jgi:putative membrane protein insertion efficiency factor
MWHSIASLPALTIEFGVRTYQAFVSPLLGHHCRFQPTCSQYMIGAVRRHGAVRGVLRGMARICRCHPLGGGGYDPP